MGDDDSNSISDDGVEQSPASYKHVFNFKNELKRNIH